MLTLWIALAAADPTVGGDYVVDQTEAELSAIHSQATQRALDELPWAMRGIARIPLGHVIYSCGQLGIATAPDQITLTCDTRDPKHVPAQATAAPYTDPRGKQVTVDVNYTPNTLLVRFNDDEGGIATQYHLDGDHLIVRKTLFSPRLNTPVEWEVRYRRAPG